MSRKNVQLLCYFGDASPKQPLLSAAMMTTIRKKFVIDGKNAKIVTKTKFATIPLRQLQNNGNNANELAEIKKILLLRRRKFLPFFFFSAKENRYSERNHKNLAWRHSLAWKSGGQSVIVSKNVKSFLFAIEPSRVTIKRYRDFAGLLRKLLTNILSIFHFFLPFFFAFLGCSFTIFIISHKNFSFLLRHTTYTPSSALSMRRWRMLENFFRLLNHPAFASRFNEKKTACYKFYNFSHSSLFSPPQNVYTIEYLCIYLGWRKVLMSQHLD